jgi:large subunit ribosomal protein L4
MSEITVLNSKLESIGKESFGVELGLEVIKVPAVHQVVKAILANRRQGTHCVKTRSTISGGGSKPFKQKGTGRARQGSSRSPVMTGGAVAFGPSPRDYSQKINKKLMLTAIQSILADKYNAGKLIVVDEFSLTGKTKELASILNSKSLNSSLVVTNDKNSLALRAVKNIKTASGMAVEGFSVYEALKYENLIIEKQALAQLVSRIGK